MFYAGVVFLGIISFRRLSVDFLPAVSIPRLTICSVCPEISPEEIDEKVALPLAAVAGTVIGVTKTSSLSRRGLAMVSLEFSWGVDMDYAMLAVREKLDQLGTELPREAGRPSILRADPATEPIITIGVTTDSMAQGGDVPNLIGLTETCNALLKKRLEQTEGVAQAMVLGGVEREILVELHESDMLSLGLTIDEVVRAIGQENVNVPVCTIRSGSLRYPVRLLGELSNAEEIAGLSFNSRTSGRTVHMVEIATVLDTIRERIGWTRYNGKDILVLQIRKEAGANTLTVSENIRQVLDHLEQETPGLRLHILSDQAEFIRDSVTDVEQSILWGALLAFLVLFLFLNGLRDPCIVGLTMPVSILATLGAMSALGVSLNVFSLAGLALGIGMLGDNAIIVMENVKRLREAGYAVLQAIERGSREINLAVTASTMTNVAVFLPVLFVRSVAQQLFADMAVTMTVSLLASLLVAVTLVPVLLTWEPHVRHACGFASTSPTVRSERAFRRLSRLIEAWSKRWQEKILCRALESRAWVLVSTAALFATFVLAASLIPSEPAPEIDRKRFAVDVTMETGTTASVAAQFAGRIEQMMLKIRGVRGVYTVGGNAANPEIWLQSDVAVGQLHLEITVAENTRTAPVMEEARECMNSLCMHLAGVDFMVKPGSTTFERILRPQSTDIAIRIQGGDPAVCGRIAEAFALQIQRLPGLADLSLPSRECSPAYCIRIDRVAVARYGVTARDVAEHISQQTTGDEATVLSDLDRQIAVQVQPGNLKTRTVQGLLSSCVRCRGTPVPLSQLVHCEQEIGRTEIRREDGIYTVAITANAVGRSIGAVADELRQKVSLSALPVGYSISIGGENEEMESSFRSLGLVIGLSLLVVYMILASEYESLVFPFVILFTSPLAFIGAVVAMLVAGERYNVMSLVGIVIMIGAVDNDAVIAVDVITALRRSGAGLREAICFGMCQRLRPILMTTATTLFGILPLMLGLGRGSELVRALTIPLVGGLVTSTIFTLVVIPVIYTYIDSWASSRR
jgi:HAE1 family hydrophobic/amphiphilic exporter-1